MSIILKTFILIFPLSFTINWCGLASIDALELLRMHIIDITKYQTISLKNNIQI